VFSGAYGLASTPMGDYLDHANPFTGGSAYLIDSSGQIISAPGDVSGPLADEDAALARMLDETGRGAYDPETGPARFYVAEPVVGTPWTLVLAVPAKVLYLPLERSGRILPWLFLGAFAAAAALLAGVLVRGRESRRQLRVDAAIDGLTSVRNRRSAQAGLHRLLDDDAARPGGVAVLMIDADHFKQVNDRFGHAAGDEALRSVAATIRRCLRSCDIVGRWGGEEFLVALPGTDEAGAEAVAERIRLAVIEDVVDCDGQVVPLTVSIGLAVALPGESLASLVAAADTALYRAKDDGRNRVRINEPTPSGARVLVAPGGR
jgi:diguanylate cyclase (GGDEF)-like protein